MDILYVAILITFYGLISALAVGCAHLQERRGGMRPRKNTSTAAPAATQG